MIDLSHYDTVFDYNSVLAEHKIVALKCTQGTGYLDPSFHDHLRGFNSAVTPAALYPYHYLDSSSPNDQMRFLHSSIPRLKNIMQPILDFEDPRLLLDPMVHEFLKECEKAYLYEFSKQPIWYCSRSVINLLAQAGVTGWLWGASYGQSAGEEVAIVNKALQSYPSLGTRLFAVQYTENGRCPGVTGLVDLSVVVNSPNNIANRATPL